MRIKVVTDSSVESLQIKKALQRWELRNKLRHEFQIRWGNWIDNKEETFTLNTCEAIKNTIDKEDVLLILKKNHINCPKRLKPGKKSDFPILGRNHKHNNGTDIQVIDSYEDFKKSESNYFIEYLKLAEEYRLHVMNEEVFYAEEKYFNNNNSINLKKPELKLGRNLIKVRPSINPSTQYRTEGYLSTMRSDFYDQTAAGDLIIRTGAFGWKLRQINLDAKAEIEKTTLIAMAQKAIYALGLDFGVVSIAKDYSGRFYVLDVDPICRDMSEECQEAYIRQFEKVILTYDNLLSSRIDVTIGADPEFILKDKDTGSLIYASDFFTRDGYCGFDDRSIEAGKRHFPLVEIRPNSSYNPIDVAESVRTILKGIEPQIHHKNIGLYAGSMPIQEYWVGGHIHFGTKPNTKLIRALDNYLALPVMMIENSYSSRKRKVRYGALGNYRLKDHGGFEYCTLSSWLVEPEITSGVLCLAKVVVQEYPRLYENFLSNYSDIRAFYIVHKDYFKDKIHRILETLRKTPTFVKYRKQLLPLFKRIENCEEWDEKKDMKESWGIVSSDELYKPSSICYIPKKRREDFNLKLEDTIQVMIGRSVFNLKVYPKDDFTPEKESFVSFSEDVCEELGINPDHGLALWFDAENNIFRAGPILGIFSYVSQHSLGPFALQSTMFKKLIKFSMDKGMIVYVFTIWDTDWKRDRIQGYTYDFNTEEWTMRCFKVPDVIYDRGDVLNEENYGERAVAFLNYVNENNIMFINDPACIELTNDKWATCLFLESDWRTREYQVETWKYENDELLEKCIYRYGHVYLKLRHGSRSKGIFSIERLNRNLCQLSYVNSYMQNILTKASVEDVISIINEEIGRSDCSGQDYIIQKAIDLTKYKERSFEVRLVMQKNSKGMWVRTCMIARSAGEDKRFISLNDEIDFRSSTVLESCFGERAEKVAESLRQASKSVVELLDEKQVKAGEIAIDFGIDKDMNIYIIELNSKPHNLLSEVGAYKLRNIALCRILEYGKLLSGFSDPSKEADQ